MKTQYILAAVFISVAIAAPAAEQRTSLGTVKTVNGKIYEDCRLFSEDVDGITVFHRHGGAKIAFSDLPAPLRQQFDYDAEKAAAHEKDRLETVRKQREEFWKRQQELAAAEAKANAQAQREYLMMQQMMGSAGGYDSLYMPQYLWNAGVGDGYYNSLPGLSNFGDGYNYRNRPFNYVTRPYYRHHHKGGKDFPNSGLGGGFNQIIRHGHGPRPVAPPAPRFGIPALGGLAPSL